MPPIFTVDVVAADRKLFSGEVTSVVIPGVDGYFGVLRSHAPLVSALTTGEIDIATPDGRPNTVIAISSGFAGVTHDHVLILADAAELAGEIDIARAEQARERAERRLHDAHDDIDIDRARAALSRAINRLRVANRGH